MNETASDNESQTSDIERNQNCNNKNMSRSSIFSKSNLNHPYQTRPLSVNVTKHDKTSTVQTGKYLHPVYCFFPLSACNCFHRYLLEIYHSLFWTMTFFLCDCDVIRQEG